MYVRERERERGRERVSISKTKVSIPAAKCMLEGERGGEKRERDSHISISNF